jgi:hypothetical protein
VGAVNRTVALYFSTASTRSCGAPCSSNTVEAPIDSGNSKRPPRPKVKASGGVPMKMSSGVGRST